MAYGKFTSMPMIYDLKYDHCLSHSGMNLGIVSNDGQIEKQLCNKD
jgi:hypothetical protein